MGALALGDGTSCAEADAEHNLGMQAATAAAVTARRAKDTMIVPDNGGPWWTRMHDLRIRARISRHRKPGAERKTIPREDFIVSSAQGSDHHSMKTKTNANADAELKQ
jgi:hypothetical protein